MEDQRQELSDKRSRSSSGEANKDLYTLFNDLAGISAEYVFHKQNSPLQVLDSLWLPLN
jgi:hypothetical protein